MDKWEYTWVYIQTKPGLGNLPQQLNKRLEDGTTHWDPVEEHGRRGWELVSVTPDTASSGTRGLMYTFKRPLGTS